MISDIMSKNFQTFITAIKANRVLLMEVTDNKTKELKYLISIHNTDLKAIDGKTEEFIPIARMFSYEDSDDPFKLYTPSE